MGLLYIFYYFWNNAFYEMVQGASIITLPVIAII